MRPYEADKPKIHDISAVIDYAIEYNPILAAKDLSTIYAWIKAGADIEKDILPAMRKVCGWKKGISSFNYFTNPVMERRDIRIAAEKQNKEKVKPDSDYAISVYKWKKERGMALTSEQEALLEAHLKQKSPIG